MVAGWGWNVKAAGRRPVLRNEPIPILEWFLFPSELGGVGEQGLVSDVDAVEVADGDRAWAETAAGFLNRAKDQRTHSALDRPMGISRPSYAKWTLAGKPGSTFA